MRREAESSRDRVFIGNETNPLSCKGTAGVYLVKASVLADSYPWDVFNKIFVPCSRTTYSETDAG